MRILWVVCFRVGNFEYGTYQGLKRTGRKSFVGGRISKQIDAAADCLLEILRS